jgi:hypothetical protein
MWSGIEDLRPVVLQRCRRPEIDLVSCVCGDGDVLRPRHPSEGSEGCAVPHASLSFHSEQQAIQLGLAKAWSEQGNPEAGVPEARAAEPHTPSRADPAVPRRASGSP